MVHVYSSWFWMAILLWMRTFQRPFQKPFCGTSKGRNPPHHQCFEGLFLADGIGNDWKKWWNWRCFIEGCLNGYFGEWPLEFWQKHPSAPFPPRHLHTPTSSRFLFIPVTWKTSWEKVHETNRTQWKLCYRTPSFLWLKTVLCDIPLYLLWLGTQNPNRWYLAMVDGNVDPTFIWEYGVYI